jgi:hypothetical protein
MLWVFNSDGAMVGDLVYHPEHQVLALAIAASLRRGGQQEETDVERTEPAPEEKSPESLPALEEPAASSVRRMQQIVFAAVYYRELHDSWPKKLTDLVEAKLLKRETLSHPKGVEGTIGYHYIAPSIDDEGDKRPPVLLYERFGDWPKDGVWVYLADGMRTRVKTLNELKTLLGRSRD